MSSELRAHTGRLALSSRAPRPARTERPWPSGGSFRGRKGVRFLPILSLVNISRSSRPNGRSRVELTVAVRRAGWRVGTAAARTPRCAGRAGAGPGRVQSRRRSWRLGRAAVPSRAGRLPSLSPCFLSAKCGEEAGFGARAGAGPGSSLAPVLQGHDSAEEELPTTQALGAGPACVFWSSRALMSLSSPPECRPGPAPRPRPHPPDRHPGLRPCLLTAGRARRVSERAGGAHHGDPGSTQRPPP